jgi:transcriptional regulator with XRE-family HTH domain
VSIINPSRPAMRPTFWVSIQEALQAEWQDPEFRRAYRMAQPKYRLVREIINLRRRKGMTQTDLAANAGMYQSTISRIEAGEEDPRLSTIVRLADALDADLELNLCPRLDESLYAEISTLYANIPDEAPIHLMSIEPVTTDVIE